ncbi:MAG: class I SAM-dependent methyltransferase [Solirubrobacterales bacterium]
MAQPRHATPCPAVGEGSGRKPEGEYRCLVLGANDGHNSVRRLCEAGFAGEIVATDIAENAISRARELLAGYPNVTFDVSDLNVDRFDGPFDYIVAEGVLHHVANIGPCLRHLNDILEPDGVLIANEYEGPVRFQLPDRQVQWINAALGALPGGLLPRWTGDPDLPPDSGYRRRTRYVPPSEASVRATDPSEALCGPELKRLLPEVFRVISRRGFGGTLLSYVSEHFRFDRADSDPRVGRFVRVLIEIEDSLIDTGILDDDFVYYELGRRDS